MCNVIKIFQAYQKRTLMFLFFLHKKDDIIEAREFHF